MLATGDWPRALLSATLGINEDQQWNGAWRRGNLERAGTERLQITLVMSLKYPTELKELLYDSADSHNTFTAYVKLDAGQLNVWYCFQLYCHYLHQEAEKQFVKTCNRNTRDRSITLAT